MDKEIEYKGYTIEVEADQYADSPNEWGDEEVFLVGFDSRNFWVERKGFDMGSFNDEGAKDLQKKYHLFPIEAYIHSGVVLHLAGGAKVDRQWDVAPVGYVIVSKKEARTRKVAEDRARGLLETWNQYLGGDVWDVMVKDQDGETIDSCGGFYGYDDAVQSGKDTIDRLVEGDKITPPVYKKEARQILSDNFQVILDKFDGEKRGQIGRALQKAINSL